MTDDAASDNEEEMEADWKRPIHLEADWKRPIHYL